MALDAEEEEEEEEGLRISSFSFCEILDVAGGLYFKSFFYLSLSFSQECTNRKNIGILFIFSAL